MKKLELLHRIQQLNQDNVKMNDVLNLYRNDEEERRYNYALELIAKVESVFNIPRLTKKSRLTNLVVARSVVCYILTKRGFGSSQIGRMLKTHHATVLHAVNSFDGYLNYYVEFKAQILEVLKYDEDTFSIK